MWFKPRDQIVLTPVCTTRDPTLIPILITHLLTLSVVRIPFSTGQFLRLRHICSEEKDLEINSKEISDFFKNSGYSPASDQASPGSSISHSSWSSRFGACKYGRWPTCHPPSVDIPSHQLTPTHWSKLSWPETSISLGVRPFSDPCAFCVHIVKTITCVTLYPSLVQRNLSNVLLLVPSGARSGVRGTYPSARTRCNACVHSNTAPTLNTFRGPTIKCRACNKVYIGFEGQIVG